MNQLTNDFIAIDTNVFGQLTDKSINANRHINKLLIVLIKDNVSLLVDKSGEIFSEYKHHLKPEKLEALQKTNEAQIMLYWMHVARKKEIIVDRSSNLWAHIHRVIPEPTEENDRIFVYVAFEKDRILVSNDFKHIINRRSDLKSFYANASRSVKADVMCSQKAATRI